MASYRDSAAFDARERLVIAYAEAMTATPVEVPDALFAELRALFDEAQIVELTAEIAWENHRARFNRPFLIGAGGFSTGAVCVLPER